jgi:hypothetical protein
MLDNKMGFGMEELDLTYLSTGVAQHVFVRTGKEDHWVYKIPAAFGYVLPHTHRCAKFNTANRYEKLLRQALIKVPRAVYRAGCGVPFPLATQERVVKSTRRPNLLEPLLALPCSVGEKLTTIYLRRKQRNHFESMLRMIRYVSDHGLDDILVPYKIVPDGKATLRIDNRTIHYKGPILVQRRADFFFEKIERLTSFRWKELVEAQQLLWRIGVGFQTPGETLGPKNWALAHGRLRLADTDALTRDYDRVRNNLSEDRIDKKAAAVVKRMSKTDESEPVSEYFRFIRSEINQDKLARLWQVDLCLAASRDQRPVDYRLSSKERVQVNTEKQF